MGRFLSDIRASVQDILRDEFVEGIDSDFEPDELNRFAAFTLREIEQRMPYEVKDTSHTTTADSKDIDISDITNLIRLRRRAPVEYPVGYNPKKFRNATVFAKTMSMEIDILPSSGESVYIYCLKKHTLTDATSTLDPQHEDLLIMGVCARAAIAKGREQLNALNVGGVNVGPRMIKWGQDQLLEYKSLLRSRALKDRYEALPRS